MDHVSKFATGVTVITTILNDDIHGMTANAFMSVSIDPKLITVSIDQNAQMHEKIKQSGKFAVSILSEEQKDISLHFAGRKKDNEAIDFDLSKEVPVINNSLVTIVCNVYSSHEAGDHTLYIGEVTDMVENDGNPLIFFERKFGFPQMVND